MCQPARQDDPTITDGDRLFRRVSLLWIVRDDDTGQARVSTGAFKHKELSVDIESVLLANGGTAETCLRNYPKEKLIAFTAGQARQFQQIVCRDPIPDNPAHGLVCGSKSSGRIHRGLCDSAVWIIPPQAPPYVDIAQEKAELGIGG